jgi:hypothetical protein
MAECEGRWSRLHGPLKNVQIGVAGTRTTDLDEDLTRTRLGHRHLAELGGLLCADELECLHVAPVLPLTIALIS